MRDTALLIEQVWGVNVAAARSDLGLTQEQLALLCDVTQQTISKVERGVIRPRDRLKLRLAHALGRRPAELFPWPSPSRREGVA